MFSKTCEYALKVMIHLAAMENPLENAGLKDIAKAIASPEAFTGKILQKLVKGKLLNSVKGPNGGFTVNTDKQIFLIDIVRLIDGPGITEDCVLGLPNCGGDQPCPVHNRFVEVRKDLTEVLESTSLEDVKGDLLLGSSYLRL